MIGFDIGMAIEIVVAILLVLTIGYCVVLNQRLSRLRADEEVLRATIAELITATEIAERAILGLKATASECERALGARLQAADDMKTDLDRQVIAGNEIVRRISAIVGASMPPTPAPVAVEPAPAPAVSRTLQSAAQEATDRLAAYRRGQRVEAA